MNKGYKKLIFICILMILTMYIGGLVKAIKDILIVPVLGAEVTTALKLYGTLPVTILMIFIYIKLLKKVKRSTIYYILNIFFSCFLLGYIFFVYPNSDYLNIEFDPDFISQIRQDWYGLNYLLIIIIHWTQSLFYIVAEVWSSMMFALLFWQIINQITAVKDAKRIYPIVTLVGQLGLMASGETVEHFADLSLYENWNDTFYYLVMIVVLSTLVISINFFYFTNFVVDKKKINDNEKTIISEKMSFRNGIKLIISSRYVVLLMMLIFCYSFTGTLIETVWKGIMRISYPSYMDYGNFMGKMQKYCAMTSIALMLASAYFIRFISWKIAALITPVTIIIATTLFLLLIVYYGYVFDWNRDDIASAQLISVMVLWGGVQSILGSYRALFDTTKEMAFIPLNEPIKSVSKAFEVMVMRFAEAGGALVQLIMLSFIDGSSIISLAPNILFIFLIFMAVWILSTIALSSEFNNKVY